MGTWNQTHAHCKSEYVFMTTEPSLQSRVSFCSFQYQRLLQAFWYLTGIFGLENSYFLWQLHYYLLWPLIGKRNIWLWRRASLWASFSRVPPSPMQEGMVSLHWLYPLIKVLVTMVGIVNLPFILLQVFPTFCPHSLEYTQILVQRLWSPHTRQWSQCSEGF